MYRTGSTREAKLATAPLRPSDRCFALGFEKAKNWQATRGVVLERERQTDAQNLFQHDGPGRGGACGAGGRSEPAGFNLRSHHGHDRTRTAGRDDHRRVGGYDTADGRFGEPPGSYRLSGLPPGRYLIKAGDERIRVANGRDGSGLRIARGLERCVARRARRRGDVD